MQREQGAEFRAKKVAFLTLGCKVNQYESEAMLGLFIQAGYMEVAATEIADVYVVNTCSVTSLADKKSRNMIRRIQRLAPAAKIAVTGCYAQSGAAEIKKIITSGIIIGTDRRREIVELVEAASGVTDIVSDISKVREFEELPLTKSPDRTRAFLKIQDGCDNYCSFCIIPYTRGHIRSRDLGSVVAEARRLVAAGFGEIVLTGIHLGAYGKDNASSLFAVCKELLAINGLVRLRLGSLESVELSDELLFLMRDHPKFAKHLHLPLQAGSDKVLRAMKRHYERAEYAALIEKVRAIIPNIAISTDLIAGFPTETDEDFADGLSFIEKMQFMKIHAFPYSKRTGTVAAAMPEQVAEKVKKARVLEIQEVAARTAKAYLERQVGKTVQVIWETEEDGVTNGLTDTYLRVYTKNAVELNTTGTVTVLGLYQDGLLGE